MSEFDRLSESFSEILLFLGLFIVFPTMCYVFYDVIPSGDSIFTFAWLLVSATVTVFLIAVASPFLLILVYLLEFCVAILNQLVFSIVSKSGH